MANTQQTIFDGLPEHLRPIYASSLRAMGDAPANKVLVMCGALYAMEELSAGRPSPQFDGMRHKDWSARMLMNRTAATYPRQPVERIRQEANMQDAYLDFETPRFGTGGAVRQG
ncbi:hypothetical protein [Ewingella americana]|uniref:hypothetical protein n=1 Tax=Ewingella americana TaxID=41202 RepID=UPI0012AD99EC|nr:hypothetical protein [Ewingella americana]MRT01924.1 hypothetical protein [Ewingella americana]